MASVFRRTYRKPLPADAERFTRKGKAFARWTNRKTGKLETAPLSDCGGFALIELPCWYIVYRDAAGRRRLVKGYADKRLSEDKARRLELQAARVVEGHSVADADKAQRKIAECLKDWLADMDRAGRSAHYRLNARKIVEKAYRACEWPTLAAIRPARFEQFLSRLKAEGRSARTLNHYLETWRAFLNYAVGHDWLAENPLRRIRKTVEAEKARNRRALTESELRALFGAAPFHRRVLYQVAAYTGLRKGELARLTWPEVHLDCPAPYIHVPAASSKARRDESVDLHPDVVALLRELKAATKPAPRRRGPRRKTAPPADVVFVGVPDHETFDADLERAGIAKRTEHGTVDFHCLRVSFCTMLAKAGVSVQDAMRLMRHTDIRLTTRIYTDARLLDTAGAVAKLPRMTTGASTMATTPKVNNA